MADVYNVGDKYYLPVRVREIMDDTYTYPVRIGFENGNGCMDGKNAVKGIPGILLTAEDIATVINTERDDALAELKSRNAELEALLKEVMATRDEAIRQNDELITKNNELEDANCNLTKACSEWQIAAQTCADNAKVADAAADNLRKENRELKAKIAENADTISRLSANKVALTEEVGRLRETVADRTIDVQHLTEENDKLKAEHDKEKETAKTLHVVLNDGTEIEFRRYTAYDYRTDINMFVVKDGEKYIAGFLRWDKPINLAYWWTE